MLRGHPSNPCIRVPRSVSLDSDDLLDRAMEAHYADLKAAEQRRGHSREAASDIVHDLYIKLAEQPDVLKGKRSLMGFLSRAAINLGVDRMRRTRFEERMFSGTEDEAIAAPADADAPDHALEIEARLAVLRDAIAALPARRRSVFILHHLHRMEPDEIARKLNISRNMVDRHLRRAVAHCLDRLLELG
jgi:RNA polymerase sigma-70 factor (ECF subfamily)